MEAEPPLLTVAEVAARLRMDAAWVSEQARTSGEKPLVWTYRPTSTCPPRSLPKKWARPSWCQSTPWSDGSRVG